MQDFICSSAIVKVNQTFPDFIVPLQKLHVWLSFVFIPVKYFNRFHKSADCYKEYMMRDGMLILIRDKSPPPTFLGQTAIYYSTLITLINQQLITRG